ncbi:ABC transporter ATP-binding protein [Teichococcus cervicalis]
MAQVTLRKVVKAYEGGVQAVKGIDLDIADHEFVVLVGPSGCGKSTTLRMIAGLEEISDGEIAIGGRVVNDVPPRDRDIAMVFQNYALYPHMTVFDNMAFGLMLRKFPKDEIKRRVDNAARILDITPLLERKPKALSGGQRQRVAMGRAIVRDPKVFLFDEPLSNLDAKLRVQMRTEIKKVHQTVKTTTIYVTHDQVEAMTLADRVVVMNGGIIEQVGPPQELYHNPRTRFVAGFIGSPAMNFIPGRLENGAGALRVHLPGDIVLPVPAERTARYTPLAGREILFGIRPEHLTEAKNLDRPHFAPMTATPEVTEPMGMETLVHFKMAGGRDLRPRRPAGPGAARPASAHGGGYEQHAHPRPAIRARPVNGRVAWVTGGRLRHRAGLRGGAGAGRLVRRADRPPRRAAGGDRRAAARGRCPGGARRPHR